MFLFLIGGTARAAERPRLVVFDDDFLGPATTNLQALTQYISKYAEKNVPLWDELTVAIFLDPTLVTKETTVFMDVDVSHGPSYGSARIWGDSVAPHNGERKVVIIQDIDVKRFVDMFVHAMQEVK